MRILLYAAVDLSLPGGLEAHVLGLAAALTARGHQVEIFGTPASLPPYTMVDHVDPGRYDVLHHHGGLWPRALATCPKVVRTFHFCVPAKMEVYVRRGRLRTLANLANWRVSLDERASVHHAAALVAVSDRLCEEIARWHGVPRARIEHVPNAITRTPAAVPRTEWRARHGIDGSAPVLLTIGRRDFVKGLDLLERAWNAARPANAIWVQVGGAPAPERQDRIGTGPLPPDQVAAWIAAADLGAFPSYYEGGGIALLEMLAGGLHTLSHDVGCAREVIHPGRNGALVAPSETAWTRELQRLLRNLPPRHDEGPGAEYDWPAIAERLERIYTRVAAQ